MNPPLRANRVKIGVITEMIEFYCFPFCLVKTEMTKNSRTCVVFDLSFIKNMAPTFYFFRTNLKIKMLPEHCLKKYFNTSVTTKFEVAFLIKINTTTIFCCCHCSVFTNLHLEDVTRIILYHRAQF